MLQIAINKAFFVGKWLLSPFDHPPHKNTPWIQNFSALSGRRHQLFRKRFSVKKHSYKILQLYLEEKLAFLYSFFSIRLLIILRTSNSLNSKFALSGRRHQLFRKRFSVKTHSYKILEILIFLKKNWHFYFLFFIEETAQWKVHSVFPTRDNDTTRNYS